ncbi:MAG: sigma-70 family RNA polymerase sigma factor [Clostridia bacterium]|nr:sigma-70 family RNA polymerase sigma factor [Clostridia bacterium]
MEDSKIVELYWLRSEKAIAESEQKYGKYCHSIANGILRSREDSEECVNDTWLAAWNAMPPHRPSRLATFLGKITRRIALHRAEKNNAGKRGGGEVPLAIGELEECIPAPREDVADEAALATLLDRFLEGLPEMTRTMFLQRYWYLRTCREIARELGVGESRVKVRLHRARAQLREMLEKEGIGL